MSNWFGHVSAIPQRDSRSSLGRRSPRMGDILRCCPDPSRPPGQQMPCYDGNGTIVYFSQSNVPTGDCSAQPSAPQVEAPPDQQTPPLETAPLPTPAANPQPQGPLPTIPLPTQDMTSPFPTTPSVPMTGTGAGQTPVDPWQSTTTTESLPTGSFPGDSFTPVPSMAPTAAPKSVQPSPVQSTAVPSQAPPVAAPCATKLPVVEWTRRCWLDNMAAKP